LQDSLTGAGTLDRQQLTRFELIRTVTVCVEGGQRNMLGELLELAKQEELQRREED
jgi:hypothetical protein